MNDTCKDLLKQAKLLLIAANSQCPDLSVTFSHGRFKATADSIPPQKRGSWGDLGLEIRSNIQKMNVGEVRKIPLPKKPQDH